VNLTVQQLTEKLQEEDPQAQVIVVGRCEQCEHEVVHRADPVLASSPGRLPPSLNAYPQSRGVPHGNVARLAGGDPL
jgi:hypothetical protein